MRRVTSGRHCKITAGQASVKPTRDGTHRRVAVNLELQRVVLDDLRHMLGTWQGTIEDASLRRESTILRRLLHEDDLGRAWRDAGFSKEPEIYAPYVEPTIARYGPSRLKFLCAGGGSSNGLTLQSAFFVDGVRDVDDLDLLEDAGGKMPLRPFRLSRYLNSASIVTAGVVVSRRQLVLYVANKVGGAHLDQRRPEALRVERALDGVRGPDTARLTGRTTSATLANKDAVLFELLSIGYCVTRSADVEGLMTALAKNLGGNC